MHANVGRRTAYLGNAFWTEWMYVEVSCSASIEKGKAVKLYLVVNQKVESTSCIV